MLISLTFPFLISYHSPSTAIGNDFMYELAYQSIWTNVCLKVLPFLVYFMMNMSTLNEPDIQTSESVNKFWTSK